MLPILRLIPVGGVFLAIAILLLALHPPRATSPSARAVLLPARGALIDRGEHPEWRQFLIQAALRRADEIERLRDLRDTVVRSEPPMTTMPAPAWIEAEPAVVEAAPVEAEPETEQQKVAAIAPTEAKPEAATPKITDAAPAEATPEIEEPKAASVEAANAEPDAVAPKVADTASTEAKPDAATPKIADAAPAEAAPEIVEAKAAAIEPAKAEPEAAAPKVADVAPIDVKPEMSAPMMAAPESEARAQMASIAPAPVLDSKPATPAAPSEEVAAASTLPLETNGSRIRPDVAPATPSPPETKIAALPTAPAENDSDDITGSIEPTDQTATIPVGIGAASSTELMVTLPRERPPVLRELDLRRARDSEVIQPRRRVRHVSRARTKKKKETDAFPPEFALFALLIKAFDPNAKFDRDAKFAPIKPTIPYQPNNSWQKKQ